MCALNIKDWNQCYLNQDTPWVHDQPVKKIATTIEEYVHVGSKLLEIGCGYGVESIELAHLGYRVTGVDISQAAIDQAKIHAGDENVAIDFRVCDAIIEPVKDKYDAILDIAVFPRYGLSAQADKYIDMVQARLVENGYWFSMVFFAEDVAEQAAAGFEPPPNILQNDYYSWIAPTFQIIDTVETIYLVTRDNKTVTFPAKLFVLKLI